MNSGGPTTEKVGSDKSAGARASEPGSNSELEHRVSAGPIAQLSRYGIIGVAILEAIIGSAVYGHFLALGNVRVILVQTSTVGIIAVAMTFVIIAGAFDLSVGAIYALSGTVFAGVAQHHSVVVGALAGLGVGIACGAINGIVVARFNVNAFVATFGTGSIFSGIAYVYSRSNPFVVTSSAFGWLGTATVAGIPFDVLLFGVAVLVGGFTLWRTSFGRHVYAVGGNLEAARLCGLATKNIIAGTFLLSGLMSGLAGIVEASILGVGQANIGASAALTVIAMVVVGGTSLSGGVGSMWRTVVGVLLLGGLTNLFNSVNINSNWQLVATGLIVVFAVGIDELGKHRQTGVR